MSTILFMITGWDAQPWVRKLRAVDPDLDLRVWPDIGDPADIDYALAWKPDGDALASLPNLKVVFSLGAGVDHILSANRLPNVPLVRIVDPDLTNRMSEYVVLHALSQLRRSRLYEAQQQRAQWVEHADPGAGELRVGVMGYGVLGRDAARKLSLMGFDVAAWNRTEKLDSNVPLFHGREGLGAFLARTDLLACLLPLTPNTKNILNIGLFRKMPRDGVLGGPILINAGRGGLQVEADILAALDEGSLAAAVLDVFQTEPLPSESPLWKHPKVTITPHNAAVSDPRALVRYIHNQIGRFERGEALENVVDPTRGY